MREIPELDYPEHVDFDKEIAALAKRHNVSLIHAACFTCNYRDPYICGISIGGCKFINECEAIYQEESKKC